MSEQSKHSSHPLSSAHADAKQSLAQYGLGSYYHLVCPETNGPILGRVVNRQGQRFSIATAFGLRQAEISGRLSYMADGESDLPVVGDWVLSWWEHPQRADELGLILELCPRLSVLQRQAPGTAGGKQVLAANVQNIIIVWPLDRVETEKTLHIPQGQLSYVRWGLIQRFLTVAQAGNISAILVLNKADLLSPELQADVAAQARQRWPELPVLVLSQHGSGLQRHKDLLDLLPPASCSVLVGLSGAGKSTLLNQLDQQAAARVQGIRHSDHKGRHTTTHRQLYTLAHGALIIDTPGIRELGVWGDRDSLDASFGDLSDLMAQCQFANCRHESEPGCAVQAALQSGELRPEKWAAYRKEQAELAQAAARQLKAGAKTAKSGAKERLSNADYLQATAEQRKWKQINQSMRHVTKENRHRD